MKIVDRHCPCLLNSLDPGLNVAVESGSKAKHGADKI